MQPSSTTSKYLSSMPSEVVWDHFLKSCAWQWSARPRIWSHTDSKSTIKVHSVKRVYSSINICPDSRSMKKSSEWCALIGHFLMMTVISNWGDLPWKMIISPTTLICNTRLYDTMKFFVWIYVHRQNQMWKCWFAKMLWIVNVNIVTKKNWIPKSKWAICKLKKGNAIASKVPKCQKPSVFTNCFWVPDAVVQENRKEQNYSCSFFGLMIHVGCKLFSYNMLVS